MKTVILIPARYASTRFPGKPLCKLTLPSGDVKTLIQLSWEAATAVRDIADVFICTDDERIKIVSENFGAKVIMTSVECRNGTERCAEALKNAGIAADLVVNFQGDAPLTPPWFVEALVQAMKDDETAQVVTPVLRCDLRTYKNFIEDRKEGRVGGTTVVFDKHRHALYFSKEVVPFINYNDLPDQIPVFHHVGIYAYRPSSLLVYTDLGESLLEHYEGLEQLRFLENGSSVTCVEVEGKNRIFWELNNPVDISRIEAVLKDTNNACY